jgi:sugar phosphate isomerase/epimerase
MAQPLQLGYNTNGLSLCELEESIELLGKIGYQGIAITLDHDALNPYDGRLEAQLEQVMDLLREHGLRSVVETGARHLLDPDRKHEPTLVSAAAEGHARRVDFLCRAIDVAAALGAECVSLWSGAVRDGAGDQEAMDRLVGGLAEVLCHADRQSVQLAFEPEPEMFIDTLGRYRDLLDRLEEERVDTSRLGLTIDVGHLHCQGEVPIADEIRRWSDQLVNVHIEDMRAGVHEHLMFGEGEIDFPPVIAALAKIGYAGLVSVELSRHNQEGPPAARRAYEFLRPMVEAYELGGRGSCRAGSGK